MDKLKEMRIEVPEGYEIDKENSTFECIKFKPKSLTYDDVAKELFKNKSGYFIYYDGSIKNTHPIFTNDYIDPNNATSKKQLEKLLAINKLMNAAKYLNANKNLCWRDVSSKYYPFINCFNNKIDIGISNLNCFNTVFFKSRELLKQAINILGEDTIRLALSTDY